MYKVCSIATLFFLIVVHPNLTAQDQDSDGDGVFDFFDQDDDNDGILDTEEWEIQSVNWQSGGSGSVTGNFITVDGTVQSTVALTSVPLIGNATDVFDPSWSWVSASGSNGIRGVVEINNTATAIGVNTTGVNNGITLSQPVSNPILIFNLVPANTTLDFSGTTGIGSIFIVDDSLGASVTGATVNLPEPPLLSIPVNNGTSIMLMGSFSTINFVATGMGGSYDLGFTIFAYGPDTDNDAIPNHLDLDSDGDSCVDANEAYGLSNADADGNGRFGTGFPPAVNAFGMVIGASYSTPIDNDANMVLDYLEGTMPAIVTQPSGSSVNVGTDVLFTVGGNTSVNVFQWQVSSDGGVSYIDLANSTMYSGVTSPSLTVIRADENNNGNLFRAVTGSLSNPCFQEISTSALLNVQHMRLVSNRRIMYRVKKF